MLTSAMFFGLCAAVFLHSALTNHGPQTIRYLGTPDPGSANLFNWAAFALSALITLFAVSTTIASFGVEQWIVLDHYGVTCSHAELAKGLAGLDGA